VHGTSRSRQREHRVIRTGFDFYSLSKTLVCSEKILIAGVNGLAAGYGVSSLALFDLVYVARDASFFTPFVEWGMVAEGGSSFSFPRLMGHQKAAALFLAGEAQRLGTCWEDFEGRGVPGGSAGIAKEMVKKPNGALRATKKLMREPVRQRLLDANDRGCDVLQNERAGSEAYRNAVRQLGLNRIGNAS
jgi:peroxisomal 3,2-trans-enoyl-CoA isomerase